MRGQGHQGRQGRLLWGRGQRQGRQEEVQGYLEVEEQRLKCQGQEVQWRGRSL